MYRTGANLRTNRTDKYGKHRNIPLRHQVFLSACIMDRDLLHAWSQRPCPTAASCSPWPPARDKHTCPNFAGYCSSSNPLRSPCSTSYKFYYAHACIPAVSEVAIPKLLQPNKYSLLCDQSSSPRNSNIRALSQQFPWKATCLDLCYSSASAAWTYLYILQDVDPQPTRRLCIWHWNQKWQKKLNTFLTN